MRNITKNAVFLFLDGICKRAGNNTAITKTVFVETNNKTGETRNSETYYMKLHGNAIASLQTHDGYGDKRKRAIHITLAGWNTVTTRERLNGLLKILWKSNLHIVQHKYKPCLATFKGNKRLTVELNPNRWYCITELEHMANELYANN